MCIHICPSDHNKTAFLSHQWIIVGAHSQATLFQQPRKVSSSSRHNKVGVLWKKQTVRNLSIDCKVDSFKMSKTQSSHADSLRSNRGKIYILSTAAPTLNETRLEGERWYLVSNTTRARVIPACTSQFRMHIRSKGALPRSLPRASRKV